MTVDKHEEDDATLLKALLDATISDAIVVADARGMILRVIPTTVRMFGHSAAAMVGHSINMLMPEPDHGLHDGYMQRYLETGRSSVIGIGREVVGLRSDGTRIPLMVSLGTASLRGEPIFVAIMHDLTLRKKREQDLAQARRLEEIAKLTGVFAHDFNNLLTIAMGNLELLQAAIKDRAQGELLQDALGAVELGAELTARLLAFGRRSNLAPERIEPNAAVRRTVQLLRRTIGKRVQLRLALGADLPAIIADPVQLQTALLNLAVNAQDAMPEGGTVVFETASLRIDDPFMAEEIGLDPGVYLRICVCDTGTGMDRDTVQHAFEPFFTTKTEARGTGLGLSMVYGFMRQSNGQATIESQPGGGTTVSLFFPVADPVTAADVRPENPDLLKGAGQTILVVEDDDALRRLTVSRITALGYRAIAAESAGAALRVLAGGPRPALVFSDVVMPGAMNGHALALHLRAAMPDLPVLLTSGYAEQLVDQPEQTRFPLLRKPFAQAELAAALRRMIDRP
ncbi:MAG: ATP-binding protein [Pseudomonadota bacterium]